MEAFSDARLLAVTLPTLAPIRVSLSGHALTIVEAQAKHNIDAAVAFGDQALALGTRRGRFDGPNDRQMLSYILRDFPSTAGTPDEFEYPDLWSNQAA